MQRTNNLIKPVNPTSHGDYNKADLMSTIRLNKEPKCSQPKDRDIAKMIVRARGCKLDPGEHLEQVELLMHELQSMPREQTNALKMAYLFSSRVPEFEREDFFQELSLTLLEKSVRDEKLAYTIARCDWVDWWKRYTHKNETEISLDAILDTDGDGESENRSNGHVLSELAIGAIEYEQTQDTKAKRIIEAIQAKGKFGERILEIATKRLAGEALTQAERRALCDFVHRNPIYYLSN